MNNIFGDLISSYTRIQAIEDGVLIDLSTQQPEIAQQLFKVPVACTSAVWNIIKAAVASGIGNDYAGVIWDLLYMSRRGITCKINDSEHLFQVIIKGSGRDPYYTLKAACGPGDDAEPVITIMLPEED